MITSQLTEPRDVGALTAEMSPSSLLSSPGSRARGRAGACANPCSRVRPGEPPSSQGHAGFHIVLGPHKPTTLKGAAVSGQTFNLLTSMPCRARPHDLSGLLQPAGQTSPPLLQNGTRRTTMGGPGTDFREYDAAGRLARPVPGALFMGNRSSSASGSWARPRQRCICLQSLHCSPPGPSHCSSHVHLP